MLNKIIQFIVKYLIPIGWFQIIAKKYINRFDKIFHIDSIGKTQTYWRVKSLNKLTGADILIRRT